MFSGRAHLDVHVCTMTVSQQPFHRALSTWLLRHRHTLLVPNDAPSADKLDAARRSDLCILLLGSDSSEGLAASSFTLAEMEFSLAQDAAPGKVLVFAQAEVTAPSSPEQADFIERLRSFAGGTFQATCATPEEFVKQVAAAVPAWQATRSREALNASLTPDTAIMISSTGDLVAERSTIRECLNRRHIPVIDYQVAASESVAPVERVVRWASDCRALVLVLGHRYGFVSPIDGLGITELEFVTAFAHRRPIVVFFRADAFTTQDPDQQQFVERVRYIVPTERQFNFTNVADLRQQITRLRRDLPKLLPGQTPFINEAQADKWYRRHLTRWLGQLPVPGHSQTIPLDEMILNVTTLAPETIPPPNTYLMGTLFVPDATPNYPMLFPAEALERSARLYLVGGPGSGKSTVLRWFALRGADGRMPIYLSLERFAQMRLAHEVASLRDFIDLEEQRLMLAAAKETVRWYGVLQGGSGLLLLDDLDSVPAAVLPLVLADIQQCSESLPVATPIIVAGRNGGEDLMAGGFTRYVMAPLNQGQQQLLVQHWVQARFGATLNDSQIRQQIVRILYQLRISAEGTEWTANPLLLGLYTAVNDSVASAVSPLLTPLPPRGVYRRVLRALLLQGSPPKMLRCKEAFLMALAQRSKDVSDNREPTAEDFEEAWLTLEPEVTQGCERESTITAIINSNGLLVRREHGYAFLNESIWATYMALWLSTRQEQERLEMIVRHRLMGKWVNVIVELVSELDRQQYHAEATRTIETLMRADQEPILDTDVPDLMHTAAWKATYAHINRPEPFFSAEPGPTLARTWRQMSQTGPNAMRSNSLWLLYLLGSSAAQEIDTLLEVYANKDATTTSGRSVLFALIRLAAVGNEQARDALRNEPGYGTNPESLHDRLSALAAPLDVIRQGLDSSDDRTRFLAAIELRKFGRLAQDCVPRLITLLQSDASDRVRTAAAESLSGIGSADAVVPLVQAGLQEKELMTTYDACKTIKILGPLAAPALPYVIEGLKSANKRQRGDALGMAAALGPLATPALGIIMDFALNDPYLYSGLQQALQAIGGNQRPLIEGLRARLHSPDRAVVLDSLQCVQYIGAAGAPLLDDIRALVQAHVKDRHNWDIIHRAVLALGHMQSAAVPALPEIEAALKDTQSASTAVLAIEMMKQSAMPIMKSVIPLLDSKDAFLRSRVLDAIRSIAPPATPELLAKILPLLDDENQGVRYAAFVLAAKLKPLTFQTAQSLARAFVSNVNEYFIVFLMPYQTIADAGLPARVVSY